MRAGGLHLLLLLLFPLLPAASPALGACPPRGQPALRVEIEDPEPRILPPVPAERLGAEHGGARIPGGQHLGLTASRVAWQAEIAIRYQQQPGGGICAVPGEVRLRFVHAEHTIRLASEIPAGGCLAREVMAHERRHAELNRRTLREAGAAAERAARGWIAQAQARAPDSAAAGRAMQADLDRAMAPVLERLRTAREQGHAEIDSAEEYRRLGRVCPEDQRRLRAVLPPR